MLRQEESEFKALKERRKQAEEELKFDEEESTLLALHCLQLQRATEDLN
jgi:hypothetical protein